MELYHWIGNHGFDLLEAVGIIGSLSYTAAAFRRDRESRQVENLLNFIQNHREIWKELLREERLKRILDPKADVDRDPITPEERVFVTFLVTHLSAVFYAKRDGLTIGPSGEREDVLRFFSLPIPKRVWNDLKGVQNPEFVEHVEECLGATPVD